jgi:hypothetical protein
MERSGRMSRQRSERLSSRRRGRRRRQGLGNWWPFLKQDQDWGCGVGRPMTCVVHSLKCHSRKAGCQHLTSCGSVCGRWYLANNVSNSCTQKRGQTAIVGAPVETFAIIFDAADTNDVGNVVASVETLFLCVNFAFPLKEPFSSDVSTLCLSRDRDLGGTKEAKTCPTPGDSNNVAGSGEILFQSSNESAQQRHSPLENV